IDRARTWDFRSGKLVRLGPIWQESATDDITDVTLARDGDTVAVGRSGVSGRGERIELRSLQTGKLKHTLKVDGGAKYGDSTLRAMAFSPDGTILASSSFDEPMKLWSVQT